MGNRFRIILASIIGVIIFLGLFEPAQEAFGIITPVTHEDLSVCDVLSVPPIVDELGEGFPPSELISAIEPPVPFALPCPGSSTAPIPGSNERTIEIVNLSGIARTDVWYVADPSTSITNVDGIIVGPGGEGLAFKIDTVGVNRPLMLETISSNGIFDIGESWLFVLQDYSGPGDPAAFGSPIVVSSGAADASSGSIISVPFSSETPVGGNMIPIDSTMVLVAGTHSVAAWMIPVIVSGIGFAIVIARKF